MNLYCKEIFFNTQHMNTYTQLLDTVLLHRFLKLHKQNIHICVLGALVCFEIKMSSQKKHDNSSEKTLEEMKLSVHLRKMDSINMLG